MRLSDEFNEPGRPALLMREAAALDHLTGAREAREE